MIQRWLDYRRGKRHEKRLLDTIHIRSFDAEMIRLYGVEKYEEMIGGPLFGEDGNYLHDGYDNNHRKIRRKK